MSRTGGPQGEGYGRDGTPRGLPPHKGTRDGTSQEVGCVSYVTCVVPPLRPDPDPRRGWWKTPLLRRGRPSTRGLNRKGPREGCTTPLGTVGVGERGKVPFSPPSSPFGIIIFLSYDVIGVSYTPSLIVTRKSSVCFEGSTITFK